MSRAWNSIIDGCETLIFSQEKRFDLLKVWRSSGSHKFLSREVLRRMSRTRPPLAAVSQPNNSHFQVQLNLKFIRHKISTATIFYFESNRMIIASVSLIREASTHSIFFVFDFHREKIAGGAINGTESENYAASFNIETINSNDKIYSTKRKSSIPI